MIRLLTITGLGLGLVAAALSTEASAQARGYNGTWSVHLVTDTGPCNSEYAYTVAILNGQVRPLSGDASISGRIAQNGTVGLTIQNSSASGTASGRLRANSGSGSWTLPSLCTGRWTARRQA